MRKFLSFTTKLILMSLCAVYSQVMANSLIISNTTLTGQNQSNDTWQVRFNITWDNAWRDNINWDGVWVFCKFRVGTNAWSHATLSPTGFSTGSGTPLNISISCDQKGAFITQRDYGMGTVTASQVELRWHYGADGVGDNDVPDVNIYGMEMVYIPTGPFTIGDGNGTNNSASGSFFAVSQHLPYTIDHLLSPNISAGSNMTNVSSNPANFIRIDGDDGLDIDLDGIIDSAYFPTGYNAFYIMKYEMTQGQYVDFLNALAYAQQSNRVNSATNIVGQSIVDASVGTFPNRNTIQVQIAGVSPNTPRVYSTARPDRGCGHLNGADILAYLDWAALRPMTELEYEKACRGPKAPILHEYAWGNTNINSGGITLSGTENGTEISIGSIINFQSQNAVSQGDGGSGPVRVGIFATPSTNSQFASGATFYGVMNMGDNLNEPVISIGNVAGRSFRGNHGDGILHANGHSNQPFWPGSNGNTNVTIANSGINTNGSNSTAAGLGMKLNQSCCTNVRLSGRDNITTTSTNRTISTQIHSACRGVRTAFTGEFTNSEFHNLQGAFFPNTPIRFEAAQTGQNTNYSWSFPSGSPSNSSTRAQSVTWASTGTYNVSLNTSQGACSASSQQNIVLYNSCMPPSNTSWTQDVPTTWHNAISTSVTRNSQRLFDGITSGSTSFFNFCRTPSVNDPAYVHFDFGSVQTVWKFRMWSVQSTSTSSGGCIAAPVGDFELKTASSLSGPWTSVYSGTGINLANWQDFDIPATASRYWRLEVTSLASSPNNATIGPSMYEVAFEGCQ